MAEAGGTSTQDGIFFQNSVAARYLADLLDLGSSPPRERVVNVRVEAPSHVDDLVVRYADGHMDWIQVKVGLRSSGDAWNALWRAFSAQQAAKEFGAEDRLILLLGERTKLGKELDQLCARAANSVDHTELTLRLGGKLKSVLAKIETEIGSERSLEVLRRTTVEVTPLAELEDAFSRRRLGTAFALPDRLFSILRDIAGGAARHRALFLAAPLRKKLSCEFGIDMAEPRDWGLPAYRGTVERLARIEIPGTGVSAPVNELFVWPSAYRFERGSTRDFDDELPGWDVVRTDDEVDMRLFPDGGLDRCIVVAGPGYGKSALLQAIQARLIHSSVVPVLIHLGTFGASDLNVLEYLTSEVNRAFDVRIDWHRLAEQGSVAILFDGLDEIPLHQRKLVLSRIAMMSARHPLVPWILTIRDPAVLSGPTDAQMLELLPLENADIFRFAKSMKARQPRIKERELAVMLETYPDIARLARIPLFLSMLLANWKSSQDLPNSRSELIEAYLRTLFVPADHKIGQATTLDKEILREIAEALAFESIERQEIGATERQVHQVAGRARTTSPELVLERLLLGGVLRRQSSVRLQFPYPIVQEYLAACYLVRTDPAAVACRVSEVVKRPWAQVMQFAIELLPESSQVIEQMLEVQDDAFSTGLRLAARCVVNGAKVNKSVHFDVGQRLASLWSTASWKTRDRVGQLIVDGFSIPLHPAVRQRLGYRRLTTSGAGEIVNKAKDPTLTREVVQTLLAGRLSKYLSLHAFREPFSNLGDEVLDLIAKRARQPGTTDEELAALKEFLEILDHRKVSSGKALDLALDQSMPDSLRLVAFSLEPNQVHAQAWPVVEQAFLSDSFENHFSAIRVVARAASPRNKLLDILKNDGIPYKNRVELADTLKWILPDDEARFKFIKDAANDLELRPHLRDIMGVYLSRYGIRPAFEDLLSRLTLTEEDIAGATLASLSYWPEHDLGLKAAHACQTRVSGGAGAVRLAHWACTGLKYKLDKDGFRGGVCEPTAPHPASADWAAVVESWAKSSENSLIQRLQLLIAAHQLGSRATLADVESIILSIGDPDSADYDEDDYGNALRSALDELRRRNRMIPLEIAQRFALAKRPNLHFGGIASIAAHANRASLDKLLELHANPNQIDNRSDITDSIEQVAGRLGVTIYRREQELFCSM